LQEGSAKSILNLLELKVIDQSKLMEACMQKKIEEQLNLGPINQIGFVVRDLESAINEYQPLFGEFQTMDAFDMDWEYKGKIETSSIRIALAQHENVEIELIEWISGKTPHKDFLDEGHAGMHHLRWIVDDLQKSMAEAMALGYESIWYKKFMEGLEVVYMKKPGDSLYIELFENKLEG
jgi:methylmalonyl-CoA/ethylmalonyl-CoA epimerase